MSLASRLRSARKKVQSAAGSAAKTMTRPVEQAVKFTTSGPAAAVAKGASIVLAPLTAGALIPVGLAAKALPLGARVNAAGAKLVANQTTGLRTSFETGAKIGSAVAAGNVAGAVTKATAPVSSAPATVLAKPMLPPPGTAAAAAVGASARPRGLVEWLRGLFGL